MIPAKIFKQNTKADSFSKEFPSYLDNRVGFWATVTAVHSDTNRVDVKADVGILYYGIPVISREWVCLDDNKKYVSGSRNLPPLNSRVLVFMPTHTIAGAVVIGSGYAAGESASHTLYAKNKDDVEKLNNSSQVISVSGWKETENYDNGNKTFNSNDNNIELKVYCNDDGDIKKQVYLKAFDKEFKIDENQVSINVNGSLIQLDNDGISITDKNNRKIVSTSSGFEIYLSKDSTSSNYIKMSNSGISMKGNSGTLEIS